MSLQQFAMQISAFLIALFLYPSSVICNSSLFGDGRVLHSMKATMDDPNTWTQSNHTTHCSWIGVQCDLMYQVVTLNLSNMNLSGSFPNQITDLSSLRLLNVSHNFLNGSLPSDISKLKNLEVLDISYNNLSGALPLDLNSLQKLRLLKASHNDFSGGLPLDISKLKNLEVVDIFNNSLSGVLPLDLSSLVKLEYLDLGVNNFSGSIPREYGKLKNLEYLSLSTNNLRGRIPGELGNLGNLKTLYLGNLDTIPLGFHGFNRFNGGIPREIGNLSKLIHLNMNFTGLHGSIPVEIGGLKNLETMYLGINSLTGEIPVELSELHKLRELDLSYTYLQGGIPYMIGNLQNLEVLLLASNDFTGLLPQQLGVSGKLQKVDVSDNRFTGSIPPNLCNGGRLQMLDTSRNSFSGTIPEKISSMLINMDLSDNRFNGSLPSSIGKLSALQKLVLSGNQLTGTIPREIGNCSALESIYLGGNELIGPIPVEISFMTSLKILDVSGNHLNESIPIQLQNMQTLTQPDFSVNNFSGIIQEDSLFCYLDQDYFAGNPYLYTCTSRGQAHRMRDLLLVLALLFCLLLLVVGAAIYKGRGRAVKKIVDPMLWEMTPFQKLDFGSDDIVQCLKEENIIGKGGAGVVYRGTMPNGQEIAVKKLTGIGIGSSNDHGFSAEVNTLGKIRHRHIVTLLAFCSNHDTNLLVYEYMPKGSLGELLHGNNEGHLDWDSRYKIAVEAAKGLRYIHHDCSPLIVHRDVKSNNILLDSNFEAHIADFGLAKLLRRSGTSECTSSVKGTFGYIAPEYACSRKVEEKSDIYSFGVVLLELITGKRPVEECEFEEGMNLAGWVKKMTKLERGRVREIIDPKLSNFRMEDAMHMFFVASLCLQERPRDRPSMHEIVDMLTHRKPRRGPNSSPNH